MLISLVFYKNVTDGPMDRPTDQQTDVWTDRSGFRDARTQLNIVFTALELRNIRVFVINGTISCQQFNLCSRGSVSAIHSGGNSVFMKKTDVKVKV